MTDAELRDAAVAELKLTTAGWRKPNGNPNYPSGTAPPSTHWGKAMNLLAQISQTPPSGTVLFNGDMEVADILSQWTSISNGSVATVTAEGGVTPRAGSRMAKAFISTSNRASWSPSTLQASLVQKNNIPSTQNNNDIYTGWSTYIVPGFQYASAVAHVSLVEWHGTVGMDQAPFHWGVLGNGGGAGQFFVDLHRAATGYSPIIQIALGAMTTGAWVDCILRTKWSSSGDGRFVFWSKTSDGSPMTDANKLVDYTGATWNIPNVSVYPICGAYRGITSNAGTVYHDAFRVGTTFAIVDPGSY